MKYKLKDTPYADMPAKKTAAEIKRMTDEEIEAYNRKVISVIKRAQDGYSPQDNAHRGMYEAISRYGTPEQKAEIGQYEAGARRTMMSRLAIDEGNARLILTKEQKAEVDRIKKYVRRVCIDTLQEKI